MNPNDLADISSISSDTVIRRSIVSNDGHRILVVGTIPEQGVASVGIHLDAVRIDGSMEAMAALEEVLSDMLIDMDDTICGDWQPVHCWCGEEHPKVESKGTPGYKRPEYRVRCPKCGLRTAWYKGRTDALVSWQEEQYEEDP